MTPSLFKSPVLFSVLLPSCIVSIFRLMFNFFSLLSKSLATVPSAPIITVTFMFRVYLQLSNKIQVFVYLFTPFYFLSVVRWNNKIYKMTCSFFLVYKHYICPMSGIHWYVCISEYEVRSPRGVMANVLDCDLEVSEFEL